MRFQIRYTIAPAKQIACAHAWGDEVSFIVTARLQHLVQVNAIVSHWRAKEFCLLLRQVFGGTVLGKKVAPSGSYPDISEVPIPRWLFDRESMENEVIIIHTCYPRFIARLQFEASADLPLGVVPIDAGLVAVPVEWIDWFDQATFDTSEMSRSLRDAWRWPEGVD